MSLGQKLESIEEIGRLPPQLELSWLRLPRNVLFDLALDQIYQIWSHNLAI